MAQKTLFPMYVTTTTYTASKWLFRDDATYELSVDRSRIQFTPRPKSQEAKAVTVPRGLILALELVAKDSSEDLNSSSKVAKEPSKDIINLSQNVVKKPSKVLKLTISGEGSAGEGYIEIRGGGESGSIDLEAWISRRLTSSGGRFPAFHWLANAWSILKGALKKLFPCFTQQPYSGRSRATFQQTVERRRSLFGRKKSEPMTPEPFSLTSDDGEGTKSDEESFHERIPPLKPPTKVIFRPKETENERELRVASLDRKKEENEHKHLGILSGDGTMTLGRSSSLNVRMRKGSQRVKENMSKIWKSLSVSTRKQEEEHPTESSTYQSFEKLDYCFHIDEDECPHCNEVNAAGPSRNSSSSLRRRRRRHSSATSEGKRSRNDFLFDVNRQSVASSIAKKFDLDGNFIQIEEWADLSAGDDEADIFDTYETCQDWYYEKRKEILDEATQTVAFDNEDDTVIVVSDMDIYKIPRKSLETEEKDTSTPSEEFDRCIDASVQLTPGTFPRGKEVCEENVGGDASASSEEFDRCIDAGDLDTSVSLTDEASKSKRGKSEEPFVNEAPLSLNEIDRCVEESCTYTPAKLVDEAGKREKEFTEENVVHTCNSGTMRYIDNSASLRSLREHGSVANVIKKFDA